MKLPAFQFYVGDWRKDPSVQSLSYHDRGVWFEILCLMHESDDRGRLLLNGKKMPEEALARILGIPLTELTETIETLLNHGVGSVDESGVLFCRRMVRDQKVREFQTEAGKTGGNPALGKNYNAPGFVYAIQRSTDGAVKIGISTNPTRRMYKLQYDQKPAKLEMLAFMHVADMGSEEAALHAKYSHCKSGEWFTLNGEEQRELLVTLGSTLKGKPKVNVTPSVSSSYSFTSSDEPPDFVLEVKKLSPESIAALKLDSRFAGVDVDLEVEGMRQWFSKRNMTIEWINVLTWMKKAKRAADTQAMANRLHAGVPFVPSTEDPDVKATRLAELKAKQRADAARCDAERQAARNGMVNNADVVH